MKYWHWHLTYTVIKYIVLSGTSLLKNCEGLPYYLVQTYTYINHRIKFCLFFFFFYGLQHIQIFLHCYRLEMQNMLRYVLKSNVAKVRQFQNKASLYQLNSICCHFGIADKKKKIMWRQGPLKCRVQCGCNSYSPLRMALCEGDSCKTKTQNKTKTGR